MEGVIGGGVGRTGTVDLVAWVDRLRDGGGDGTKALAAELEGAGGVGASAADARQERLEEGKGMLVEGAHL